MDAELFLSWPAGLCAVVCSMVVQGVKSIVDARYPKISAGPLVKSVDRPRGPAVEVLPTLPIVIGIAYGGLVPLRPEAVIAHVDAHETGELGRAIAFAVWGGAGGFASAGIYDRIRAALRNPDA